MIGITAPERYTHHAFDRDIVREIKTLQPDNWHGLLYLGKDYVIIAAAIYLSTSISWWFYPISVLLIGAHQRGISTLLHDSAHGVLAKHRLLNFLLGTAPTAWLIFQRHFAYRESHVMTHHPYLGRADRDPDLEFFISEGVFQVSSDRSFIWRIIVLPLLGSKTWAYMKYLVRHRYQLLFERNQPKANTDNARRSDWRFKFDRWGFSFFWLTVAILGILTPIGWYTILFWIVPYLTSFHTLGWFIEMSEHCSSIEGRSTNILMARNRRSRHIEKWLTDINNDSYHLDHHIDPTTPFWLLPKAHNIRLRDLIYANHCAETGGIFQSSLDGAPSILSILRTQNRERFSRASQSTLDVLVSNPA